MDPTLILSICIAGAVTGIAFFVLRLFAGDKDARIISRLSQQQPVDSKAESIARANAKAGITPLLQRIGQAASQPFTPKDREQQSKQRRLLGYAGIYNPSAAKVLNGAKVILLGLFLAAGYGTSVAMETTLNMTVLLVSVGGLIGYLGPTLWLKLKIGGNQRALTYGLPDALDLMVVCVESGLTVDGAMQRVGSELGLAHPALSRELAIAHMETRVGLSRSEAMKNLGSRTGTPCLIQLASMLVQADRFGTSIAQALRVQADTLRNQRQAAAEEMAAKASVKMSFPLVLFIFPATFIVLAGPTVIGLLNSPLFK
jgi:tight adherence protein C